VVEKWNDHTKRRIDVYGFGDILACSPDGPMLIQATSGSNGASRVTKIATECAHAARAWLESGGRIEVWAWRKYAKPVERRFWRAYETVITLDDLRETACD
jgi:hypothetical protein